MDAAQSAQAHGAAPRTASESASIPEAAPAKGAPAPNSPAAVAPPTSPYRLLGILDVDRQNMVAFAMKVPADWRAQQTFSRKWLGAVGMTQVSVTLDAPDGRSHIVYFPSANYAYNEGPLSSRLRAAGAPPLKYQPESLPPMPPVDYLQRVFLPSLAQNGVVLKDVANPQTAPQTRDEQGQIKSRGSVDATMPNGNRARIECRLFTSSRQIGSDVYHTWNAVTSITQTATGDLEAVHAHTRVAQESIVPNPAWIRIEQDAHARGQQANANASSREHEATMATIQRNTEAMTQAHNQRMAAIRQFGEMNTANFNQRMSNMDRDQRIRIDTIRGESQYANPTTGQRVKVADGYNHVYNSQQHPSLFLGTDAPINAGALDWQELQKVQLRDY